MFCFASRGNYNNQFPYLTGTPCSACPSGTTCANNLCDDGSGNTNVVGKHADYDYLCMRAHGLVEQVVYIFILSHPCHYCHFFPLIFFFYEPRRSFYLGTCIYYKIEKKIVRPI